MKRLKWHRQKVGPTSYIIGSILFLLFLFNLLDQIDKGQSLISRSYLTVPFFIMALLSIFTETKTYISIVLYICAVYAGIDKGDDLQYSIIMFIISFGIRDHKVYGLVLVVSSFLIIAIKATISDLTIYQSFNQIIAYGASYFLYYTLIYKQPKQQQRINTIDISEEEKAIIKLYAEGYNYEQISRTLQLNITNDTIRRKIKKVKGLLDCKNDVEFGKKLYESV